MVRDPANRPTAEALLSHPFIGSSTTPLGLGPSLDTQITTAACKADVKTRQGQGGGQEEQEGHEGQEEQQGHGEDDDYYTVWASQQSLAVQDASEVSQDPYTEVNAATIGTDSGTGSAAAGSGTFETVTQFLNSRVKDIASRSTLVTMESDAHQMISSLKGAKVAHRDHFSRRWLPTRHSNRDKQTVQLKPKVDSRLRDQAW